MADKTPWLAAGIGNYNSGNGLISLSGEAVDLVGYPARTFAQAIDDPDTDVDVGDTVQVTVSEGADKWALYSGAVLSTQQVLDLNTATLLASEGTLSNGASVYVFAGQPPGGGAGDMLASVYDPQSIEADAFARDNHTGTQTLDTISDAGTAAASDAADFDTAGTAAAGDSAHVGNFDHDNIPTSDQKAALDANPKLAAGDAVAALSDIPAVGGGTDISVLEFPTSVAIGSSTGSGDAIPEATAGGNAGVLSGADKQVLDSLSDQALPTPRITVNGNGNSWVFRPDANTYDYYPDPLYSQINFAVASPVGDVDAYDYASVVDFHAPESGSWTFTLAAGDLLNGFVPPVINAGDPPVSVLVRYLPGQIAAQISYLDSTDPSAFDGSVNADRDGSGATTGTYAWDVTNDPGGFVTVPTGDLTFANPTNPPSLTGNRIHNFLLTVTFGADTYGWGTAWKNPPTDPSGKVHIAGIYDGTDYVLGEPVPVA